MRIQFALSFVVFLCLALVLQMLSGAYASEFNGYPDEPAHFTTGLMVRDYLAAWPAGSPMSFAEDYYLHYPKIAFGHWPPLFYILEGVWLLILPVSRITVLILMAIYTALVAAVLSCWLSTRFPAIAAWLTAAIFVTLPAVQEQTNMVMVEMLLTLMSLLAAIEFANFVQTESWGSAVRFGLLASLAILTKGNGWALVLLPPIVIALNANLRLLRLWKLWLAAAIVGLLAIPWQILTLHMAAQGWASSRPGLGFTLPALREFLPLLFVHMDPVVFLVSALGVIFSIGVPLARKRPVDPGMASMLALIVSVYLFHSLVPTGVEPRKMIMGFPGMLAFLPAGIGGIAGFLKSRGFRLLSRPLAISAAIALFFASETFAIPRSNSYGFKEAASWLSRQPDLSRAAVLIVGTEGSMIAEEAIRENRPSRFLLRATKLLSDKAWSGRDYRPLFANAGAIAKELNRIPVRIVVLDFSRDAQTLPEFREITEMLRKNSADWRLIGSWGAAGSDVRPLRIYRHAGDTALRGKIRVDLTRTLNRIVER